MNIVGHKLTCLDREAIIQIIVLISKLLVVVIVAIVMSLLHHVVVLVMVLVDHSVANNTNVLILN